jgi:small-conductance mechanosensitive channel
VTFRRFILILLSPFLLALAFVSLVIGSTIFSGTDLAATFASLWNTNTPAGEQMLALAMRVLLLPFQLFFIAIIFAVALWVIRRRNRFGAWVLGDPLAERLTDAGELPALLQPGRRRTLRQIFSSIIVVVTLVVAAVLSLGQFIDRADLAVVVAALTTSLTWGARLPIGDILGGISSIFESNLSVGDRIIYRQVDRVVDGVIEAVNLRFLSVRALSGELITIPFDELRIFRNYSRGKHIGVYATFPVASADLAQAIAILNDLTPESTALVFHLVEPWQPMSLEGQLGAVVDLCLFGKAAPGDEDDLHLEMHELVQARFWEAGIRLRSKEAPSA